MIRSNFILGFLLFLITCANSQELDKKGIQEFANDLLIAKGFNAKINKILPIIDDLQIVVIEPPYREYPSILLIKKDLTNNKWIRVFECLSPGIQDNSSGLLDWHTKGLGVDFEANKDSINIFHGKTAKALVEATMDKKEGVIITYQNFFHMNTSDPGEKKKFAPYTIDKTKYYDFANKLMDNRYTTYPTKECTMFDSPKVSNCDFNKENNLYKITVQTSNNQTWIYTFEGIDENFRYLLNKNIEVKKAH